MYEHERKKNDATNDSVNMIRDHKEYCRFIGLNLIFKDLNTMNGFASLPISEIKQRRIWLVPRRVTTTVLKGPNGLFVFNLLQCSSCAVNHVLDLFGVSQLGSN